VENVFLQIIYAHAKMASRKRERNQIEP